MSNTHGVFQHRSGYYYTILEEDFCEMYKGEGINEVCRAYVTSILETLTDKQYDASNGNDEIWVYMSLPEMARRMRHACSERTIHKEIQGMIKDGYLAKRRAEGKATMEYRLNIKKIRNGLSSLPEIRPCKSARYDLANLQEPSSKSATSILQNSKNDLANLQPRISNRLNIEETKNNYEEENVSADAERTPASSEFDQEQAETLKALQAGLMQSGVIGESENTHVHVSASSLPQLAGYTNIPAHGSNHATSDGNNHPHHSEVARQAQLNNNHIATTDTPTTLLQAEQERENHHGNNGHSDSTSSRTPDRNNMDMAGIHQGDTSRYPQRIEATQQQIGDAHNGHGNTHHHGTGDTGDSNALLPLVSAGGGGSTTGTQPTQEVIPIGVDKSLMNGDKSSKGKKLPKPKDETLEKRIDAVYAALDTFKQEVMDDPDTKFRRTKIGNEEITELLVLNPTLLKLRKVFYDMWNEKDQKTGDHFWRKHMSPQNVCKHYEARLIGLEGKEKKPEKKQEQDIVLNALINSPTINGVRNLAYEMDMMEKKFLEHKNRKRA